MKRYRIFCFDFNLSHSSFEPAKDQWDENVKRLHEENRLNAIEKMKIQFGDKNLEYKIQNFIDLKEKFPSIIAFHNKFLEQCRNSFVIGSYYPALTSACALGERVLNHLIIKLRENYRSTPEYKKVYKKNSFDDWTLAIETLESWSVLLPETVKVFNSLKVKRNHAIHFNPETDTNDRELALKAIHDIQDIIRLQFGAIGNQPWLFVANGECYIRQEWEDKPFIKLVYLPRCGLVGYKHNVKSFSPRGIEIADNFHYCPATITLSGRRQLS